MASLTIHGLDENLESKLRAQAERHGRSMEEEAREILAQGLATEPDDKKLGTAIREIFEPLGGVDLEIPPRQPMRPPPDFSR